MRTLAGNGQKGQDYVGGRGGASQPLNSPWDVVVDPQVQPPSSILPLSLCRGVVNSHNADEVRRARADT